MSSHTPSPHNRPFAARRSQGPRRVRHGIKLRGILDQNAQGAGGKPEDSVRPAELSVRLARQFIGLLEARLEPAPLAAGLEYARMGQVVSIDVHPGLIEAQVQGSAPRPYVTQLRLPVLAESQWQRVLEAMAGEAVYLARLLAGELPPGLEDLLASLGLVLLPVSYEALQIQCTCTGTREKAVRSQPSAISDQQSAVSESLTDDSAAQSSIVNRQSSIKVGLGPSDSALAAPCTHAAAAGYLAAEKLVENPLLFLTLLGMPAEQLFERLRRARMIQTRGVASAHADAAIPEAQIVLPPLEACLDEFWRCGPEMEQFLNSPPLHHVPHALLRRLGPSPMNGRFPLAGLLASVYDTVAAHAARLRDQPNGGDDHHAPDNRGENQEPG